MQVEESELPGVLIITPRVFPDDRGFFKETFQEKRYHEAGITVDFVQGQFLALGTWNPARAAFSNRTYTIKAGAMLAWLNL